MGGYDYGNLTGALKDSHSPLREHLDERFPNSRPLQSDYRSRVREMKVAPLPSGGANPGTLGAAFDYWVRFTLDPHHSPELAVGAFLSRPREAEAVRKVIEHANRAAPAQEQDELARACWALALCTEVFRTRMVHPGSPLDGLHGTRRFTHKRLLALAPEDALRQMRELAELAQANLLPHLRAPLSLGPTFDASVHCAADADLISDGLLLDIKAGTKANALSRIEICQLLGYTLFDHSDTYRIDRIGIYAARFGALVTWELAPALDLLAGGRVSVAEERQDVWDLLTRGNPVLDEDDYTARGEDDDSGYGPDSYYARAMQKDD